MRRGSQALLSILIRSSKGRLGNNENLLSTGLGRKLCVASCMVSVVKVRESSRLEESIMATIGLLGG